LNDKEEGSYLNIAVWLSVLLGESRIYNGDEKTCITISNQRQISDKQAVSFFTLDLLPKTATGERPPRPPALGQLCSRRTLPKRNHPERPSQIVIRTGSEE
jgi:hypothetical protein